MKRVNTAISFAFAATTLVATLWAGTGFAQPVAESPAATPAGMVTTFHRKSTGSLGTFDGPVVWTFSHGSWEGRSAVIQMARLGGVAFDPKTHAYMANLDPEGKTTMVFDPPMGYQWPLQGGKTWTSKHTMTAPATGRSVPLEVNWKVEAWEDVTVPAGTHQAHKEGYTHKFCEGETPRAREGVSGPAGAYRGFKVFTRNSFGGAEALWTAPAAGIVLAKRLVSRPATHPQGAGELEAVLLSQVPPAK